MEKPWNVRCLAKYSTSGRSVTPAANCSRRPAYGWSRNPSGPFSVNRCGASTTRPSVRTDHNPSSNIQCAFLQSARPLPMSSFCVSENGSMCAASTIAAPSVVRQRNFHIQELLRLDPVFATCALRTSHRTAPEIRASWSASASNAIRAGPICMKHLRASYRFLGFKKTCLQGVLVYSVRRSSCRSGTQTYAMYL